MVGKHHLLLGHGRFLLTILWFLIAVLLLLSGVVHSFAFSNPHVASFTLKHQRRHVQQQLVFQQRFQTLRVPTTRAYQWSLQSKTIRCLTLLNGWVQRALDGEWEWAEDDPNFVASSTKAATATFSPLVTIPSATPQLPSGSYRPKQSLGQNYLKDPNTVAKILRAFHQDAMRSRWHTSSSSSSNDEAQQPPPTLDRIIELGPGAGALTDKLVETYGAETIQCIEIDDRSVDILREKHPNLDVLHDDVLQVDYPLLACGGGGGGAEVQREDQLVLAGTSRAKPLVVIGNLPYYITSQILFALADASHVGAIQCATVTMQWEVGQRLVAKVGSKEYGILSVVFQLYTSAVHCHFKIPPTVFYPKPKVDSALIGLHFAPPDQVLQPRLAGVNPIKLRRVVTTAFQQRRKTLRNSLRKLARDAVVAAPLPDTTLTDGSWDAALPRIPLPLSVRQLAKEGDVICAQQELPDDWASKRPEELTPGQFVELTRKLFGPFDDEGPFPTANMQVLPAKVWRKLKHGPKE
ncbi:hypothetical protein ACA910_010219 [Epithemia clementina (nom. ined.)]